ncbi:capsule assembly Wzi family protein [Deltaproteobacteria bacterium TL4]
MLLKHSSNPVFSATTLMILCFSFVLGGRALKAEVLLSSLDFWYFEHLENQELRGGKSRQLSTRPIVLNPWKDQANASSMEFQWDSYEFEYSYSSLMPVIQNREGNWISQGSNLLVTTGFTGLMPHASIWLEPKLSFHENQSLEDYPEGRVKTGTPGNIRYPKKEETFTEVEVHTGYLIFNLSNWYLFLGKDNLRFGTGKHDTLHLSNSAKPFPMIRIGTLEPWDTRLGAFSFLSYLGQMEEDRYIPNAKFSGWRFDWSSNRIEFGASRSWFVGGDGKNENFSHMVGDLYVELFKNRSGAERDTDNRNQQLVIDLRVKIPEIKLVLYGEFGREDHEHNLKDLRSKWDHSQGHIIGVKQLDLIDDFFWIIESADNTQPSRFIDRPGGDWYTHYEYKSGWTYEGIGLGHHMGANSKDLFVAMGFEHPKRSWMIYGDHERHNLRNTSPDVQEEILEFGIQGTFKTSLHTYTQVQVQHQNFQNFGAIMGKELSSSAFSVKTSYQF